jgi:hypothetical protein
MEVANKESATVTESIRFIALYFRPPFRANLFILRSKTNRVALADQGANSSGDEHRRILSLG